MKAFKRHLAFIVPLVALLFGLQCVMLIDRSVAQKEKNLIENYSVVLASTQKLDLNFLTQNFSEVIALKEINPNESLEPLKKTIGIEDFMQLKKNLPFFYSLQFSTFPSQERLEAIRSKLFKIPGVQKVEVFAKTHMQVYELLNFIKVAVCVFALLVFALSVLLLLKQIRVWIYEYQECLEIMDLLGASMPFRNGFLFKMALIDSLIASLLTPIIMVYVVSQKGFQGAMKALEIVESTFIIEDFFWGLLVSFVVSLFLVLFVVWRSKHA
ncbi:FtsX-like permease family protein [Helicobacter cetorum]|uniref:Cell division protein FtsX n=1 Tax=Helicobacter cetorum (strain ATCC BAA-429 / MIT 00-7128) TaxID=182217 RepID=I0EMQ8_HELC0|nr:FtsX-like permease family protein [Helicobacter cetorum]AFI04227.1 cell division protein FtsX [Helicobacter cetorum MIT 00-7128]